MLDTLDFGFTECVVRVNSVGSGLMETDLKVVFEAQTLPQTLMFPKVNSPQELVTVSNTYQCFRKFQQFVKVQLTFYTHAHANMYSNTSLE